MNFRPCVVIPVYNHRQHLDAVVERLAGMDLPCLLIDDGSDRTTAAALDAIEARHEQVRVWRLPRNGGKGTAVILGLRLARRQGFTHAVQVDADGQHDLDDLPRMLELSRAEPGALISGRPVYDESVPRSRFIARYITHAWVWLETLSTRLVDSMCGFRVYPLDASVAAADRYAIGRRMDFDTDIMVRMYWDGTPVRLLPTRVIYPPGGRSNFRVWRDNWLISRMHARLFFGMLPRIPRLLARSDDGSSGWARLGERGSLLGMRFTAAVASGLGPRAARWILVPVTAYFYLFNGRARRASLAYLRRVHEHVAPGLERDTRPTRRNAFRHFRAFADAGLDKLIAWRDPATVESLAIHGDDVLDDMTADGRGGLLVGSHLGNLEFCRAIAARRPELRVNALVYTRHARKFNSLLDASNERYRFRLIQVASVGPELSMQLRERVNNGELVVIVGDRTPAAEESLTVQAPFLGETAHFAAGPWILAHVLECPVGLMFCVRDGPRYRLDIEPFAERVRLPRRHRQRELSRYVNRYAERLADWTTRYPLQWFNFFDFWRRYPGRTVNRQPDQIEATQ